MSDVDASTKRRGRGFRRAAALVQSRVQKAGESRGFAVSRLLTHWADIVGGDIAALARPVKVSYGRSFGATLTLLTSGASAQMVQMQVPRIIERVNACYGYSAVSQIRVTQTAAAGFAEPQAGYAPPPAREARPETLSRARQTAADVADPELRAALQALGAHVFSRNP